MEEDQVVEGNAEDVTDDDFGLTDDSPFGVEECNPDHVEDGNDGSNDAEGKVFRAEESTDNSEEEAGSVDDAADQITAEAKAAETDIEKLIRQDEEELNPPVDPEKPAEAPKPQGRAHTRIQQLLTQNKAERQDFQRFQDQSQQAFGQLQTQNQELQLQLARIQGQMGAQAPTVDPDDPRIKLQKDLEVYGLEDRVTSLVNERMAETNQRFEALQAEKAENEAQMRIAQNSARYTHDTENAVDNILLKGADPAEVGSLREDMIRLVMAKAYGKGWSPKRAATVLRGNMLRTANVLTRGAASAQKQRVNQNKNVGPNTANSPKGSKILAKTNARSLSQQDIEDKGYENALEMAFETDKF